MKNKAIKITIIALLFFILIMLLTFGYMVYRQNTGQPIPVSTPGIAEESPEPTSAVVEVRRISIELESNEILRGTRFWPEVIIQPENATDKFYEIHSDNERVIRYMGGHWLAAEIGTARLTVTAANGVTSTAIIVVTAPDLESISFEDEEISMILDDIIMLSPVIYPQDAFMYEPIRYTSDNEKVVMVSFDGRVTAVGTGTATIKAAVNDISAEIKITVTLPARRINIIMNRRVYSVGDEATFTVEVDPPEATNAEVSVSFSGASVTVTGPDSFRCDTPGEVVVTFTAENGTSVSYTITVHDLEVLANEVRRLTNGIRSGTGLSPLGSNQPLTQAAHVRATEALILIDENHTRPDGKPFYTVLDENSVVHRLAAENLAAGQLTPSEVVQAWMDSPGHRINIVNSEYNYLGVGVTMDNDGRLYWVQLFTD